jgi:hypothetical protein
MPLTDAVSSTSLEVRRSLMDAARSDPDVTALRYKYRGGWLAWNWRDVVREVDRFASFLRDRDIGVGAGIAIVGEIRPSIVFGALAAQARGADVVLVAPAASLSEVTATLNRVTISLVLIHGRQALATWLKALERYTLPVQIVFDHVAPDGTTPEKAVLPLSDVLRTSPANGWADALGRATGRSAARRQTLWVESSTAWPQAAHILIEEWLGSGNILAVPELLAAAARDRAETRPNRWIASAECVVAASAEIAGRLPRPDGWMMSLTARIPVLHWLLLNLMRRRLGVSRLSTIEVERHWWASTAKGVAESVFSSLGVALRVTANESIEQGARDPETPYHSHFSLAEAAG